VKKRIKGERRDFTKRDAVIRDLLQSRENKKSKENAKKKRERFGDPTRALEKEKGDAIRSRTRMSTGLRG